MTRSIPESLRSCPPELIPESLRSRPPVLVLTAHGSADPRSSATSHAVADEIRRLRPGLTVRVAFCEKSTPNLRDVLAELEGPAVVTPLLLASAYHARVDIPAIIAESSHHDVAIADTLGEDPRLVSVLAERLNDVADVDASTGVLVVAVGSSHPAANAATETLAGTLPGQWPGVRVAARVAYATTEPSVADSLAALRESGARRVAVAPWFIARGRITDRVAASLAGCGVTMAAPLGAHPLVAECVLDRFDTAVSRRLAA